MQNINFGINLGLALRGLSSINVCSSSFDRLRRNIISVGESARHLRRNLAGIRLNNLKIGNSKLFTKAKKCSFGDRNHIWQYVFARSC